MLQFRSINCNFLHFLAIICNSVQLLAILCNNLQFRAIAFNFLQYLAEYCATSCNLVITCNYILLFASSRSWILLNLVLYERTQYQTNTLIDKSGILWNVKIFYLKTNVWLGGQMKMMKSPLTLPDVPIFVSKKLKRYLLLEYILLVLTDTQLLGTDTGVMIKH